MSQPTEITTFYKNDIAYEITINPCDSLQSFDDPLRAIRIHSSFKKQICTPLFTDYSKFIFFPEISEPKSSHKHGPQCRIHYHGIIIFTDVIGFLIHSFSQLSKYTSFQFNDFRPDYWPIYITKQYTLIRPLLKVIYNDKSFRQYIPTLIDTGGGEAGKPLPGA